MYWCWCIYPHTQIHLHKCLYTKNETNVGWVRIARPARHCGESTITASWRRRSRRSAQVPPDREARLGPPSRTCLWSAAVYSTSSICFPTAKVCRCIASGACILYMCMYVCMNVQLWLRNTEQRFLISPSWCTKRMVS